MIRMAFHCPACGGHIQPQPNPNNVAGVDSCKCESCGQVFTIQDLHDQVSEKCRSLFKQALDQIEREQ